MVNVSITVNGQKVTADIDERTLLLEFVRDVAGLTGTHNGCLEARCGCCSVELDGPSSSRATCWPCRRRAGR